MKKILLCGTLVITIISPHIKATYPTEHPQSSQEALWKQKFSNSYDLVMLYLLGREFGMDINAPGNYNTLKQIITNTIKSMQPSTVEMLTQELEKMILLLSGLTGQSVEIDGTTIHCNDIINPRNMIEKMQENRQMSINGLTNILIMIKNIYANRQISEQEDTQFLVKPMQLIQKLLDLLDQFNQQKIEYSTDDEESEEDFQERINRWHKYDKPTIKPVTPPSIELKYQEIENDLVDFKKKLDSDYRFNASEVNRLKVHQHYAEKNNLETLANFIQKIIERVKDRVDFSNPTTPEELWIQKFSDSYDLMMSYLLGREFGIDINLPENFNRLNQIITNTMINTNGIIEPGTVEMLTPELEKMILLLSGLIGKTEFVGTGVIKKAIIKKKTIEIDGTTIHCNEIENPRNMIRRLQENKQMSINGLMNILNIIKNTFSNVQSSGQEDTQFLVRPMQLIQKLLAILSRFNQEKVIYQTSDKESEEDFQKGIDQYYKDAATIQSKDQKKHFPLLDIYQSDDAKPKSEDPLFELIEYPDRLSWEDLKTQIKAHRDPFKIINDHVAAESNDFYSLLKQNYQDKDFFEYVINNFLQHVNNSASNPSMHDKLIQIRNLLLKVLMVPLQPQQLKLRTAYLREILNGMNHHTTNDFVVWLSEGIRHAAGIENVQPQPMPLPPQAMTHIQQKPSTEEIKPQPTPPQLDKEELRKKMSQRKRK